MGLWCGVVVCRAVVYGCVVDMCGVWRHVLWCGGLLHGGGGGVLWGCIAALWWVVVHCACKKSLHEGVGGILNFRDEFLIWSNITGENEKYIRNGGPKIKYQSP